LKSANSAKLIYQ